MKKLIFILTLLFFSSVIFCQTESQGEHSSTNVPKFLFSFNEGVSFGQITRIEILDDRSNFVRENMLIGAFVNCKTDDLWKLDLQLQLGAFYPFRNAFNGMQQFAKNPINYAFDLFFGAIYSFDKLKYVLIDASLGLHYMYQLSDEYHLNYVGLGFMGTLEFPLTSSWSIINNYFISYDDANLGSNKKIQVFDASYQYHIELGVRFSKRVKNEYYYFGK